MPRPILPTGSKQIKVNLKLWIGDWSFWLKKNFRQDLFGLKREIVLLQ